MLKPLSIHIKRSWIIWTKFYYNCLSDRGGQLWMKFCAVDNATRQFSYWLIKALLFCWLLCYSPQKTAWELFTFWLQGNQSFGDKLRFRSQKFGTLMFRVTCAYVPNFFRISFETEPRLFFFLRPPWLKVAASLQLYFLFFLFLSRAEAAHVEHVRWFRNLKNRSSRYFQVEIVLIFCLSILKGRGGEYYFF